MKLHLIVFRFLPVLLLSFACSNEKAPETEQEEKSDDPRLVSIEISEFKNKKMMVFEYSGDGSVNINYNAGNRMNYTIHTEFNDQKRLTEMISGKERIQYIYGPGNTVISMNFAGEGKRVEFTYDDKNRVSTEAVIISGRTSSSYQYSYKGSSTLPEKVSMKTNTGLQKEYKLTYSSVDNAFTNKVETILPEDLVYWLGWHTMYGDKFIEKAELVSSDTPEIQDSLPQIFHTRFQFKISSKDGTRRLKLVTDGTRDWSAKVVLR